ncbi:MAG TPA: NnrU family protein [bacterium]|nr:NnrU family protein [bacterium]
MALVMLIVFSVLFALTHILMSHGGIRAGLVARLGDMPFRGLYSLVSLITLGGAIALFAGQKGAGQVLWNTPEWLHPVVWILVLFAFVLLVSSLATPSPTGMMPAKVEARGILRVTRHPMNMAFALWGLGHLIANGKLGDVFFFGSIFVVGFFGAYHQDRRKARERGEEFKEFQKKTSILPFAAVITGKTKLELSELSVPLPAIALAAFIIVLFLHNKLFGVTPW